MGINSEMGSFITLQITEITKKWESLYDCVLRNYVLAVIWIFDYDVSRTEKLVIDQRVCSKRLII